jgi:hypothetical protein
MRKQEIGAVLIKNYASLDKNEKKFHVFFLKIATYQSTPKILYAMKRNQGTEEEAKETSLPCQFFPTAYSLKLTPAI